MTEPTVQDARLFWLMRAGKVVRTMQQALRSTFKATWQPKGPVAIANVNDLADGRLVCLWVAAAVQNPDWAQRLAAWTIPVDDQDVQKAIANLVELTTIGGDGVA